MAVLIQHRNQSITPMNIPNHSRSSITNSHYSSNPILTTQQLPKSTSSVPNIFNSIHHKPISNTTTVQSSTISLAAFASDLEHDITNKVLNTLNLNKNNPNNIILVTVCKLIDDITERINDNMSQLGKEFTNSFDILYKQHQQFIEQNRKCMDGFINKLNDIDQLQSNGLKLNKDLINIQNKNNNKFDCMQKQMKKMNNQFITPQTLLNESNNKQLDSLQKQMKVLIKKIKNHHNTNQIDEIANKLNKQSNEQQQSSIKINTQMNLILDSLNNTENVYLKHEQNLNKIRQTVEKTDKKLIKFIDSFENSSLSTSVSIQSLKNTLNRYNNNNNNNYNSCIEKDNNELLAIGKTNLKNYNDNESVLCINDLNATLEVFSNKMQDVSMQLDKTDKKLVNYIDSYESSSLSTSVSIQSMKNTLNNLLNEKFEIKKFESVTFENEKSENEKFENEKFENENRNLEITTVSIDDYNNDALNIEIQDDLNSNCNSLNISEELNESSFEKTSKKIGDELNINITQKDQFKIQNGGMILKLLSNNLEEFTINLDVAYESELIKILHQCDEDITTLSFDNISSSTLKLVIKFMNHNYTLKQNNGDLNAMKKLNDWEMKFFDDIITTNNMLSICHVATYLGIETLLHLVSLYYDETIAQQTLFFHPKHFNATNNKFDEMNNDSLIATFDAVDLIRNINNELKEEIQKLENDLNDENSNKLNDLTNAVNDLEDSEGGRSVVQ